MVFYITFLKSQHSKYGSVKKTNYDVCHQFTVTAFPQGSVCDDWLVMACIPACGLCQMAREQKIRGN